MKFKHYKAMIENQTGSKIVKLKTDRGGEYSSKEFLQFLSSEGIQTERGPAERPMANSVSERFNWTLLSRIQSQLVHCGLPLSMWGELAYYSSLQINCSPSKAINFQSPLDVFNSIIPSHTHPFEYNRLKPSGCLAYALDRHRKSKVAPMAKRYIFVGIEANARAWRLWDKTTKRILVTGDADFRETIFPAADKTHAPDISSLNLRHECLQDILTTNHQSNSPTNNPSDHHTEDSSTPLTDPEATHNTNTPDFTIDTYTPHTDHLMIPEPHTEDSTDLTVEHHILVPPIISSSSTDAQTTIPRRTSRKTTQPHRYGFKTTLITDSDHPSFAQAMASPDKAAWQKAMQDEYDSLNQHSVGTLVDPPPDANVLGGMWIFSKKRDENNRVVRFKARWVVFGNHQIKGLDYNDTHASVGLTDSLRILFAIAAHLKMTVCQFDVVTAFLNGDMGDTVYAKQVTGFKHTTKPNYVWLLNKSLYGTRQAARRWQQHFNKTASRFNLTPAQLDTAVYVRQDDAGLLILHLHVDDSMVFASSPKVMEDFKSFLESEYDVKWTNSLNLYLGIRISVSDDGTLIGITQDHYIEST